MPAKTKWYVSPGATVAKVLQRLSLSPSTALTSSPDVSLSNALILVQTSRYELGQPCPKFSGRQEVLAYQRENRYYI